MATSQRDERGRFSSSSAPNAGGAGVNPAADAAPRGPAANIGDLPTATRPGTGGMQAAASIAHDDHWGGPSLTDALLNRPAGGQGGGAGDFGGAEKPEIPDYEAGFNKLKFGGPDLGRSVLSAGTAESDARTAGRTAHDASLRASGYGGPEGPGQHTVSAPGGPAYHGADVPGGGIPRPGDYGGGAAPGGGWGGGPRDWSPPSGGTPDGDAGTINLQQGDDGVWGVGDD
jgi:hypothetical protein